MRRPIKWAAVSLALIALGLAFDTSRALATEPVRRLLPTGNADPAEIKADLYLPPGTGPFPVVVALHGCGGNLRADGTPIPRVPDWTNRWLAAGYGVLWPDSFGSRGLGSQCNVRDRTINPAMRAGDVRAAVAWIGREPRLDPSRVAIVGWSNGGGTALRAASQDVDMPSPDVKVVVAFYPGCRPLVEAKRPWQPRVPVTILMGAADDWTPIAPCEALAARAGLRLVSYAGAYHDFDAPQAPLRVRKNLAFTADKRGVAHTGTNPAARAAAIVEVEAILKAAFR